MKKQRLLKLADLLTTDARRKKGIKFDLFTVAQSGSAEDGTMKVDCGTQACAIGLAAISGEFKRAGLSYKISQHRIDQRFNIITLIRGEEKHWPDAAKDLFGLNKTEIEFLFTPCAYPDEMHRGAKAERFVAKRIRDFVAGKVAP